MAMTRDLSSQEPFLPFILKAVSASFIETDGGITMLMALIQF